MPAIVAFWEQGKEHRKFEVILSCMVEFETLVRDLVGGWGWGEESLPRKALTHDLLLWLCLLFSLSGGWLVLALNLGQDRELKSLGQFLSSNH